MQIGWRTAAAKRSQKTHLQTLCFVTHNEEVLLLYRRFPPNAARWNCPGGKVEVDETPTEACIREVCEETGLTLLNPRLRGLVTLPPAPDEAGTTLVFVFEATDFVGQLTQSREGILEWVPVKYLSDEPEIVPDLPVLFNECLSATDVFTARLSPPADGSMVPRLIPDRPVLA